MNPIAFPKLSPEEMTDLKVALESVPEGQLVSFSPRPTACSGGTHYFPLDQSGCYCGRFYSEDGVLKMQVLASEASNPDAPFFVGLADAELEGDQPLIVEH